MNRSTALSRLPFLVLCASMMTPSADAQTVASPNGVLSVTFQLTPGGVPTYSLSRDGHRVLGRSRLGLELSDAPSLLNGFTVERTQVDSVDRIWEPVLGEQRSIRDHYRQLTVTLRQKGEKGRSLVVVFRLFDDGLGFRYEFPDQEHLRSFIVREERTEFALTGDHMAFWIPGDYDSQEYVYNHTRLSAVHAFKGKDVSEIAVKALPGDRVIQSPVMMKTREGLYINVFEAAVDDYPVMHLDVDPSTHVLSSHLVPDAYGNKAYLQTPCVSPWRTVIVSDQATDILRSSIILNLNEPVAYEDVSWIHPVKYIGIWWEMHTGTHSWNYADVPSVRLGVTDFAALTPNGRHGATTERTKRYIDFAAEHGFDAVLVEGWNIGWEDWFGKWKEEVFDFVTPYPDFDVAALSRYAREKGVKLLMHHETSASVTNYERRQDSAYAFMRFYGYDAVKTGYVGRIIPRGEHHDGQWMVNHFTRTAKKAARYRIMVNSHESVRPTGLQRTYPNWIAAEAARGNEFNAWSSGNPPEHETVLAFTRLKGGPMDYTPGIFQITLDYYDVGRDDRQVHTTLAKQLALYVTMYSPLQMAADYPENYERFPDAFQFIKEVALDWDESHYLAAEPGDYVVVARKTKGKDEWFIGAMTDEERRSFDVPLDFLDSRMRYVATVYGDAPDAHWEKNPMAYEIRTQDVDASKTLKLELAEGGGAAVHIRPAE